jgi:hypothetical protein
LKTQKEIEVNKKEKTKNEKGKKNQYVVVRDTLSHRMGAGGH